MAVDHSEKAFEIVIKCHLGEGGRYIKGDRC